MKEERINYVATYVGRVSGANYTLTFHADNRELAEDHARHCAWDFREKIEFVKVRRLRNGEDTSKAGTFVDVRP